ncbi:MAG: tail fiber domain-containing protein [Terriglobia bacterium]
MHGALGKVERLRGVSYTYTANGKHDIGMIAEEVGKVVPEVVNYEENGKDARGIDYARLTALLVEAVKEQQKEVQQQQAQVRQQHRQIQQQRSMVQQQEKQIRQQKDEIRTLQARVQRLETPRADPAEPVTKPAKAAGKAGK